MANPITTLLTGANSLLAKEKMLEVTIEWTNSSIVLDGSCFLVQANGKVPSDDYFIFYNQPADPGSLVEFKKTETNSAVFSINLEGLLSTEIEKCIFAATLEGPGTFNNVNGCKITASTLQADVVFEVKEAGDETSLVFMELYRHQAWWKVRAIGKGFNGGLQPLAEAHGVSVSEEESEPSAPVASVSTPTSSSDAGTGASAPMPAPAPGPAAPSAAGAGPVTPLAPVSAKRASVFASQKASASVFASQQLSDFIFAWQPKRE